MRALMSPNSTQSLLRLRRGPQRSAWQTGRGDNFVALNCKVCIVSQDSKKIGTPKPFHGLGHILPVLGMFPAVV